MPRNDLANAIVIDYTNWKGHRTLRTIQPVKLRWGSNQWHQEPQWLLDAMDVEKQMVRTFAMLNIHSWNKAEECQRPSPDGDGLSNQARLTSLSPARGWLCLKSLFGARLMGQTRDFWGKRGTFGANGTFEAKPTGLRSGDEPS